MEVLEGGSVVRFGPQEHRCGQRFVELTFALVDDRLECVGLAVQPLPDATPRPFKAAQLRDCLALGRLIARATRQLAREGRLPELGVDPDELRQLADRAMPESGRRLGPEHFALVAQVYAEALLKGRRDPTQAVAERFHRPLTTAAKWVRKARDLDLLVKTTKGKPSKGIVHHGETPTTAGTSARLVADATVTKAKKKGGSHAKK